MMQAIGALLGWLIAKVGYTVAYRVSIVASIAAVYAAGFAAFYLAIKVLIMTASSLFTPPPIMAAALHFMPSSAAVAMSLSLVFGSEIIAINFKVFLIGMNTSRQAALNSI
jgi:hypothetical protein